MIVIAVEFVARRYHATPWDAHVNEGRIEWPPAPWRLLRSLLAVGYNKLGWDQPPQDAQTLINTLSNCSPVFELPPATAAHTRHYMPTRSGRNEKPAKVFDAFLRFPGDTPTMLIRYDVELSDAEQHLLKELVEGLSYLGRAESWAEARLMGNDTAVLSQASQTARPAIPGDTSRVRLLHPMPASRYSEWRDAQLQTAGTVAADQAEADTVAKAEKKQKTATPAAIQKARDKAIAKVAEPYPQTLLDSLQLDSLSWQNAGWSRPPGSEWTDYCVPDDAFRDSPLLMQSVSRPSAQPTCVLLAIDGEGKRGQLRPLRKRLLPLMELLHRESVRQTGVQELGHLPELTGRQADSRQLRNGHQHAHFLPLSLLNPRHVDHVLVWCPQGFSTQAVQAISGIRWAWAKGIRRLSVNQVGTGSVLELRQQLRRHPQVACDVVDVLSTSQRFESVTPLVLRKYLSRSGKKQWLDRSQKNYRSEVCQYQRQSKCGHRSSSLIANCEATF